MTVENVLRDTLRAAPEPPDDLGRPHTARRRAKHIRRRRYAAVTSAVMLAAVVAVGVTLPRPAGTPVTAGAPGAYPDWPRRGDGPRSLDREALAAYERSLPSGVGQARPARVLYSAGGARPVVVLHTVQTKKGERLVVVTGERRQPLRVYSNTPAPAPGTRIVSIVLRDPDDQANPCLEEMFRGRYDTRLLLITAVDRLQWFARAPLRCEGLEAQTMTEPFPLDGGAGIVDTGVTGHADYFLHGDQFGGAYYLRGPGDVLNPRGDQMLNNVGSGPLGWVYRNDGSRATDLRETLFRAPELAAYGGECITSWYASLPDGTPVAFCVTGGGGDGVPRRAVIAAEGADRKVRVYVEQPADPVPTAFAAVVDGFDGRWLVAVGPETLADLRLVDGFQRTDIPVEAGAGWLRLDREPAGDAYLTNSDHAPDGGFAIHDREGRVLSVRR